MSEMTEQQPKQFDPHGPLEEAINSALIDINRHRGNIINGNIESPNIERMMRQAVFQDIPEFGMIAMQAGLCRWVWERAMTRDLIHSLEQVWDRVVDAADTQDLRLIRDIQKVNGKLEDVRRCGLTKAFSTTDCWQRFEDETKEGADA